MVYYIRLMVVHLAGLTLLLALADCNDDGVANPVSPDPYIAHEGGVDGASDGAGAAAKSHDEASTEGGHDADSVTDGACDEASDACAGVGDP
jgi:hypothetical protein